MASTFSDLVRRWCSFFGIWRGRFLAAPFYDRYILRGSTAGKKISDPSEETHNEHAARVMKVYWVSFAVSVGINSTFSEGAIGVR